MVVGYCGGEGRGEQERLIDRAAHGGDAAYLVDRGADDSEVEPLLAADIAVEDLADMETQIHLGDGQPGFAAARIEGSDAGAGRGGGRQGRSAGAMALGRREDREHAIAHELQDIARMLMDRRDDG